MSSSDETKVTDETKVADEADKESKTSKSSKTKKKEEEKVKIKLPRLPGAKVNQEEFFSVNFKNYIIRRGVEVEVPKSVAEVILNAEKAQEEADKYAEEKAVREPN